MTHPLNKQRVRFGHCMQHLLHNAIHTVTPSTAAVEEVSWQDIEEDVSIATGII